MSINPPPLRSPHSHHQPPLQQVCFSYFPSFPSFTSSASITASVFFFLPFVPLIHIISLHYSKCVFLTPLHSPHSHHQPPLQQVCFSYSPSFPSFTSSASITASVFFLLPFIPLIHIISLHYSKCVFLTPLHSPHSHHQPPLQQVCFSYSPSFPSFTSSASITASVFFLLSFIPLIHIISLHYSKCVFLTPLHSPHSHHQPPLQQVCFSYSPSFPSFTSSASITASVFFLLPFIPLIHIISLHYSKCVLLSFAHFITLYLQYEEQENLADLVLQTLHSTAVQTCSHRQQAVVISGATFVSPGTCSHRQQAVVISGATVVSPGTCSHRQQAVVISGATFVSPGTCSHRQQAVVISGATFVSPGTCSHRQQAVVISGATFVSPGTCSHRQQAVVISGATVVSPGTCSHRQQAVVISGATFVSPGTCSHRQQAVVISGATFVSPGTCSHRQQAVVISGATFVSPGTCSHRQQAVVISGATFVSPGTCSHRQQAVVISGATVVSPGTCSHRQQAVVISGATFVSPGTCSHRQQAVVISGATFVSHEQELECCLLFSIQRWKCQLKGNYVVSYFRLVMKTGKQAHLTCSIADSSVGGRRLIQEGRSSY